MEPSNHKSTQSEMLFSEAKQVIPGGVNSPVRSFSSVGGMPAFIKRGMGSYLWDEDDNKYIDFVGSWGTAILGHAHPYVIEQVCATAKSGLSFGAPTKNETVLAKKIISALPSIEKIRFVSSGTEACMSALRLARGYTGRSLIVKFDGHYHGHCDSLLVKAGSGAATFGIPGSAGVPKETTDKTIVSTFNDLAALEKVFHDHGSEIAAVILEPIAGNAGFIRADENFLEGLIGLCHKNKTLFIFDEVMTGFRVTWGGCQTLWNIDPDLTTLGKIIGGGMPIAAFGGKAHIMDHLSPTGPVYQAGTLSGNPLATASGLATLEVLGDDYNNHSKLHKLCARLLEGMSRICSEAGIPFSYDYEGGMFGYYFKKENVKNFADAKSSDISLYSKIHGLMFERGVYFAPSAFEAGFMSLSHSVQNIDTTLNEFSASIKKEIE